MILKGSSVCRDFSVGIQRHVSKQVCDWCNNQFPKHFTDKYYVERRESSFRTANNFHKHSGDMSPNENDRIIYQTVICPKISGVQCDIQDRLSYYVRSGRGGWMAELIRQFSEKIILTVCPKSQKVLFSGSPHSKPAKVSAPGTAPFGWWWQWLLSGESLTLSKAFTEGAQADVKFCGKLKEFQEA